MKPATATGVAETVDAVLDVGGVDDVIVVDPALGGAIALACTFHPDGVINDCRRVGVRLEVLPLR